MMNRGILNPILYRTPDEPTSDCFEVIAEGVYVESIGYVVMPPIFGCPEVFKTLIDQSTEQLILPAIKIKYTINDRIYIVDLEEKIISSIDDLGLRLLEIQSAIGEESAYSDTQYAHIKIEPLYDEPGRAKCIGFLMLNLGGSSGIEEVIPWMTLLNQPSNLAYCESNGLTGPAFKAGQFMSMKFRNEVVVEDLPNNMIGSIYLAYMYQFAAAICPRVTITAKQVSEELYWRAGFNAGWTVLQLRILGDIIDTTYQYRQLFNTIMNTLIYVDSGLVDSYKALDSNIAPRVFSDEVMPDIPTLITEPGIYWKPGTYYSDWYSTIPGEISISVDGINRITISDINQHATTPYSYGDTLSLDNCGLYYQWGNCVGFNWGGYIGVSHYKVSTAGYGDGNFYYGYIFIDNGPSRSDPINTTLWGGRFGSKDTRRGPCKTGYHIPTDEERQRVIDAGISLGARQRNDGINVSRYLKLPYAGIRYGANPSAQGIYGRYWTSMPNWEPITADFIGTAVGLGLQDNDASLGYRAMYTGGSIRPFKNIPTQPDDTWIKLY